MNRWNRIQSSSPKIEELLVFGYSCKIFKDDEKASYIDQEKHMIPWMGDESLMIDRYDVRGYLHDLSSFDEKLQYADVMDEDERLCEEERYLALRTNLTEEELYHEEELKRLRAAVACDGAYHEISFSYESIEDPDSKPDESSIKEEEEDEPYQPPEGLKVPKGMTAPSNMKIHAIIEKTANFVSVHGGQMEIIIKMKQSDNPQFAFMNLDNPLQPYYRHLVQEIKLGHYRPAVEKKRKESEEEHNDGHYLHPSLMSNPENVPKFTVPNINFLRTGDDSYSLLVKNLKQRIEEDALRNSPVIEPKTESPLVTDEDTSSSIKVSTSNEDKSSPQNRLSEESSSSDESDVDVDIPPPAIQPIVDKMAEYVARNGEDFETIVKGKSDKRFDFLREGNRYYEYYIYRRNMARKNLGTLPEVEDVPSASSSGEATVPKVTIPSNTEQTESNSSPIVNSQTSDGHSSSNDEDANAKSDERGKHSDSLKIVKGPISFSLKAKEAETPNLEKSKKASVLLNDSDAEEDGHPAIELAQSDTEKKVSKPLNSNDVLGNTNQLKKMSPEMEEKPKKLNAEEMEQKLAEDKLKDKLMAAARERIAQQKKDKQLQLERKQKAALFLQMLQKKKAVTVESIEKKEAVSRNGNSTPSNSEPTIPAGSVTPISSYPPSPTHVISELKVNPPHSSSDTASSDDGTKSEANKLTAGDSSSSSKKKRKKESSDKKSSSKSHKHSHSKKRKRSRTRSPSHKHKQSSSKSRKDKKLPAAYAINRKSRSRSRSPRRYTPYVRSRSPLPYWNRWRQ